MKPQTENRRCYARKSARRVFAERIAAGESAADVLSSSLERLPVIASECYDAGEMTPSGNYVCAGCRERQRYWQLHIWHSRGEESSRVLCDGCHKRAGEYASPEAA